MVTILSPVPEPRPRVEGEQALKPRLGATIRLGLLSNGKPNTDLLMRGMLELLLADGRLKVEGRERKSSASEPADEAILARLVTSADLVVGATAD
ncbi:MAG TPA: hypothetical protein VIJ58_12895 [Candidatus Dormibacteraeota bacterium]